MLTNIVLKPSVGTNGGSTDSNVITDSDYGSVGKKLYVNIIVYNSNNRQTSLWSCLIHL